jgi:hypothetical protein
MALDAPANTYVLILSFTDFVVCDVALGFALESTYVGASQLGMFGTASLHSLAPQAVAPGLQLALHQGFHVIFLQPKLHINRFKGRAVFPSHLDDAVGVLSILHAKKTKEVAHSSDKCQVANGEWRMLVGGHSPLAIRHSQLYHFSFFFFFFASKQVHTIFAARIL